MRVKVSVATHKRRRRWIKLAKGYWGHKSIGYKVAKQQVIKSWTYAFRDRKTVKRNFRKLWIARINAASRELGINYSLLTYGLRKANIKLNRKMLSELAIHDKKTFKKIVDIAKKQIK